MEYVLTIDDLRRQGACGFYREAFLELFPEGSVVVTEERAVQHAADFDFIWAIEKLLPPGPEGETYWLVEEIVNRDEEEWDKIFQSTEPCSAERQQGLLELGKTMDQAYARLFVRLLHERGWVWAPTTVEKSDA